MHRIITGAVAIALAGSVPFIASSSAQAAPAVGHHASAASAPATAARQLPHRKIEENIVSKGPRKLVFVGKVKGLPRYDNKIVKLQRKVGKHGNWHFYKKVRTGDRAGFKVQVGAPRNGRWYFRATTPKTKSYAFSKSAGNFYTYTL